MVCLTLFVVGQPSWDTHLPQPAAPLPAGNETVKAPGNLVVSAYVTCPDITQVRQRTPSQHRTGVSAGSSML